MRFSPLDISPPVSSQPGAGAPERSEERPGAPAPPIAALLRDLGPNLRRGGPPTEDPRLPALTHCTGIPALDGLLGGGLPTSGVVEIAGPPSSGRTALALAWLAAVTGAGGVAAMVDGADALDPVSARTAGVELARLLWVRAPGLREALCAAERLLDTHGFGLVVLDLDRADDPALGGRAPAAAWLRLARAAARARTPLVMVSPRRWAGTFSHLALEMERSGARFSPDPALLEGLRTRAVLVRSPGRLGPDRRTARLSLRA